MRTPAIKHNGYSIVVDAIPAPGNRYYSVFSIHKTSRDTHPEQIALVYREGPQTGVICETAAEAHDDAMHHARAWIESHPL
jgi:hypothetical protein